MLVQNFQGAALVISWLLFQDTFPCISRFGTIILAPSLIDTANLNRIDDVTSLKNPPEKNMKFYV